MLSQQRSWFGWTTLFVILLPHLLITTGCSLYTTTMRQTLHRADVVFIAEPKDATLEDADDCIPIVVQKVLTGSSVEPGEMVQVRVTAKQKESGVHCVVGHRWNGEMVYRPFRAAHGDVEYVQELIDLADDPATRCEFFLSRLQDERRHVAADATRELSLLHHADFVAMKEDMDREFLLASIHDESVARKKRDLYLRLLGACGEPEDVATLTKLLSSSKGRSLDEALVFSCCLALDWEAALPLIADYLENPRRDRPSSEYAAFQSLQFALASLRDVARNEVCGVMKPLLDHPMYALVVLPELAKAKDWSELEHVACIAEGSDDNDNFTRVPCVVYLLACPLHAAKQYVEEIDKLHPKDVQLARKWFEKSSQ